MRVMTSRKLKRQVAKNREKILFKQEEEESGNGKGKDERKKESNLSLCGDPNGEHPNEVSKGTKSAATSAKAKT
ncbi:hypothetical protein RUM44_011860 [Polyplax serrata]|uniref:Uncharacterized protein n=1 Tax=Polyplax serrata TaxID=468196 RepID=A0ABR1BBK7_POLSC